MASALTPAEQRVADALAAHGLPGTVIVLEQLATTAQMAADALGVEVGRIVKSLMFKGATSGASEALIVGNYGHDHYQLEYEQELGLPWQNRAAYERLSSFNDVEKIVTPTLWIGGAEDWNVPILNSEQMYQALRSLGRETQLVIYPGQYHDIKKPSYRRDRLQRYLEWYGRHLKRGDAQAATH